MFEWTKSQLNEQLQKDEPTFTCPRISNSGQSECEKRSITSILELMRKAVNNKNATKTSFYYDGYGFYDQKQEIKD